MRRLALPLLACLLGTLMLASLVLGEASIPVGDVFPALLRRGEELHRTILWDLRLPRTLVGLAAGAALGASGVVMQAFFRNSLASPGLLGVSSGAALGAVAALGLGTALPSLYAVPLAATLGAFLATAIVMFFARRGASPEHMLLAGLGLNAVFGALTNYVVSLSATRFQVTGQIIYWLMGGIENRTWDHVLMGVPGILVACACLLPLGRAMNLLALGEGGAQSLGVDVARLRLQLVILSTVLTALATAVVGLVGFVGLVVPHLLRLALGPDHRRLLPLSMVGGAAFMLAADLPTRFGPAGLRLGVVTSLIGGPFLLWMLRRKPC